MLYIIDRADAGRYSVRMIHSISSYTIIHARAVSGDELISDATITVEDGTITGVDQGRPVPSGGAFPVFDASGRIAGPGLIDMHIHGAGGFDTTGPDIASSLLGMAAFLEIRGITSFQPTMVMNGTTIEKIGEALDRYPALADRIPGAYVEGPFINPAKKGGIPAETLAGFSEAALAGILAIRRDGRPVVRTMTLAPELPGAETARRMLLDSGVVPAWGHSDAYLADIDVEEAIHLTHLFNAMNGLDHRKPGLAALPFLRRKNPSVTFEIVADGVHVHPALLELALGSTARKNACLVSDGMKSAGMGRGETVYLGKQVVCDGRCSRYEESGTLIGSAMLISETARELFAKGLVDEIAFFRMASANPAAVTGMTDRGILKPGKRADLALCDSTMNITDVFVAASLS